MFGWNLFLYNLTLEKNFNILSLSETYFLMSGLFLLLYIHICCKHKKTTKTDGWKLLVNYFSYRSYRLKDGDVFYIKVLPDEEQMSH